MGTPVSSSARSSLAPTPPETVLVAPSAPYKLQTSLALFSSTASSDSDQEFSEEKDLLKVAFALLYSTAGLASGMPIDYAPAPFQKIFKLEKFLPNYSEDVSDWNIVGLQKGSRKISSPSAWMVAANGLGRYLAHLSTSQKETKFTWNEFHVFIYQVHAYFLALLFQLCPSF
jgi:hypothetical protein